MVDVCPAGQRTLQHHGDVLDTQVVVNPAHDFVCSEVNESVSLNTALCAADADHHRSALLVNVDPRSMGASLVP